jgi:beta-lactamase class A
MKIILFASVAILGTFIGWVILSEPKQQNTDNEGFKSCSEQYPLLSHDLDCGTINEKIEQVEGIDDEIESYANKEETAGNAEGISVFFRDLDTRRWFGVNENTNFYPASLAKLPIAMMIYKTAEVNKRTLDLDLPITDNDLSLNNGQRYIPGSSLESGKSYSVLELVKRMLIYSDNAPVNPLLNASATLREPIFSDLGVYTMPNGDDPGRWSITAKNYSNLFRILYNASYLRPEYSDTILEQLSESTFKNALAAGVPGDIRVAHKFGETSAQDGLTGKTSVILNDCGIVYKKNAPYILCVMTRGEKHEELERIIKEISEKVYHSNLGI